MHLNLPFTISNRNPARPLVWQTACYLWRTFPVNPDNGLAKFVRDVRNTS